MQRKVESLERMLSAYVRVASLALPFIVQIVNPPLSSPFLPAFPLAFWNQERGFNFLLPLLIYLLLLNTDPIVSLSERTRNSGVNLVEKKNQASQKKKRRDLSISTTFFITL